VAADLGLAGTSVEVDIQGTPTEVIDGTSITTVTIDQDDTLEDIVETINALDGGVTASIFYDGQGYRLSLAGENTGAANELLLELKNSVFQFQETSSARDAILQFGDAQSATGGILVTSHDNDFNQVISGLDLTIHQASTSPVTITVTKSDTSFVDTVDDFVTSYNAFRDTLDETTSFNEEDLTTGLLFGTSEALRVETAISRALTDRYLGLGTFDSLEQIGLSVTDKGQLEVDKMKLQEAFADDPEGLENFFADEDIGVTAKFNEVIERLAGSDNGTLTNRYDALNETIESNETRIERFNETLDRQRERLLLQFFQLEQVIATLQQSLSALQSLTPLEPLSIQRGS
jgi:flagellar hook-associated protein 2